MNRPPQRTVRVGQLERTLTAFNDEIGVKVAKSLARYHDEMVVPMEQKIESEIDLLKANVEGEFAYHAARVGEDIHELRERCQDMENAIVYMRLPWWRKLWRRYGPASKAPLGSRENPVPIESLAPDAPPP